MFLITMVTEKTGVWVMVHSDRSCDCTNTKYQNNWNSSNKAIEHISYRGIIKTICTPNYVLYIYVGGARLCQSFECGGTQILTILGGGGTQIMPILRGWGGHSVFFLGKSKSLHPQSNISEWFLNWYLLINDMFTSPIVYFELYSWM